MSLKIMNKVVEKDNAHERTSEGKYRTHIHTLVSCFSAFSSVQLLSYV